MLENLYSYQTDNNIEQALDLLPGIVFIKGIFAGTSWYTWANEATAHLMGFSCRDDLIGRSEAEIAEISNISSFLFEYDCHVMANHERMFLNVRRFPRSSTKALLVRKKPLRDNFGVAIGVIGTAVPLTFNDVCKSGLLDTFNSNKQYIQDNVLVFDNQYFNLNFTKRESQCFYYFLRGKSAKQTANLLNISYKTVETHIARIKTKLGVQSRSQLYECAYENNLFNIVPLEGVVNFP